MLENIRTLAPNSADNLIAQAYYTYYTLKDFDRAGHLITQAELMMPSDVRLLELKTWIQRRQGDFDGRTETIRKIQKLDPRNSQWTRILIANLVVTHRYEEAQQEIESATFDDYRLEQWRNILQLRAHHDVDKWADNWLTLQQEFEGDAGPSDRWEAFIAKRDYVAAEEILDEILAPAVPDGQRPTLSIRQASMIITYWFQKRSDLLPELLAQNRAQLERSRNPDDGYIPSSLYMDLALVSMAEGDADEAKRMVRRWHRLINDDLAELTRMRYHSCQILGMAAATAEAVKCIRTGLVEPSTIMPFMEPFLPYYDSIRDEPAFVELLAELQAAAENPKQSPYYR